MTGENDKTLDKLDELMNELTWFINDIYERTGVICELCDVTGIEYTEYLRHAKLLRDTLRIQKVAVDARILVLDI